MRIFIILLIFLFSGLFYLLHQRTTSPVPQAKVTPLTPTPIPKVDFTASFSISTHGTIRIFTDKRYHNLSEKVYIEADKPNIVHVKLAKITWGDFFKTLPMEVTKECLVTGTKQTFCTGEGGILDFYINGEKVEDALDREIKAGDNLLITFGSILPSI